MCIAHRRADVTIKNHAITLPVDVNVRAVIPVIRVHNCVHLDRTVNDALVGVCAIRIQIAIRLAENAHVSKGGRDRHAKLVCLYYCWTGKYHLF